MNIVRFIKRVEDMGYEKADALIDIALGESVKRIDFRLKHYDALQSLRVFPLDLHDGLFGFKVFEDPTLAENDE